MRRRARQFPHPGAGGGVRCAQALKAFGIAGDHVDHPEHRRPRRHRPEQRLLIGQRGDVAEAVSAISQGHREVPEHPARIMAAAAPAQRPQLLRERPGQPSLVRRAQQQRGTRVRNQSVSVRPNFYRETASIAHHLQGDPPE